MEIKVNRINSANATAEAVVANKIVDEKIDTLAKQAAKNMKIDGFRKGKIPTSVVKKR